MAHDLPLDTIIAGDCIEELRRLPEASVDAIFADPPYNLQLRGELWRPNLTKVDAVDDEWDRFSGFAAYDDFTRAWLTACRRVLSDTGTIWVIGSYHSIYRVGAILMDLGYWILNDIVWVKTNPMPNFRGSASPTRTRRCCGRRSRRTPSATQLNHHAMKRYNGGKQMRSDWSAAAMHREERIRIDGRRRTAPRSRRRCWSA